MPAPLHQIAGMVLVYRKAIQVWCALPLVLLSSPLATLVVLSVLGLCTDYVFPAIAITTVLTLAVRQQIVLLARSKDSLRKALRINRVRLPVAAFVASCPICQWLGPFLKRMGLAPTLYPIPWMLALRLATATGLLGLLVVSRFCGPTSLLRCSTMPLVSNPTWMHGVAASLRQGLSHQNSDQRLQPMASRPTANAPTGRRFQGLMYESYVQHTILAAVTGMSVFYLTTTLCSHTGTAFGQSAALVSCLLAVMGSLVQALDGVSHEVNPREYLYLSSEFIERFQSKTIAKAMYSGGCIPLLAIVVVLLTTVEEVDNFTYMYIQLACLSAAISLYLFLMDEVIRISLFNPPVDVVKLIDELCTDRTSITRLGVFLRSLLGDSSLVKEVWQPSNPPGIRGPEHAELTLSKSLSSKLANVLLTRVDPRSEAPLEEDVLRVILLESLGGKPGASSVRHNREISRWIDHQPSPDQKIQESISTPAVRGLNVFVHGMGEALSRCASVGQLASWKLPSAFFSNAEFAVVALSRCIVRSLAASDTSRSDWSSSQSSVQVPASLCAIFQLRSGIIQYINSSNSSNSRGTAHSRADNSPVDFVTSTASQATIITACDTAAISILQSVKSLKGLGRLNLSLDGDCLAWKNNLVLKDDTM